MGAPGTWVLMGVSSTMVCSEDLREGVGRRKDSIARGWVTQTGRTVEPVMEHWEVTERGRGDIVKLDGTQGCGEMIQRH